MSEKTEREWRFYLDDMAEFAGKVIEYSAGFDQAAFVADRLTYDATLRNLELIGEAATHIPEAIRASYPEVPWRMIIAVRNRLITLPRIDNDTLWSIVRDDVPELLQLLKSLKNDIKG